MDTKTVNFSVIKGINPKDVDQTIRNDIKDVNEGIYWKLTIP